MYRNNMLKYYIYIIIYAISISCLSKNHYISVKVTDIDTDNPVSGIQVIIENIEHSSEERIVVYPNPSNGNLFIGYNLEKYSEANFEIFDSHGKKNN